MTHTLNRQALLDGETIVFNNENQPWEESHELTVSFVSVTWGSHFQVWLDGQLVADPRNFALAELWVNNLTNQFDLELVEE